MNAKLFKLEASPVCEIEVQEDYLALIASTIREVLQHTGPLSEVSNHLDGGDFGIIYESVKSLSNKALDKRVSDAPEPLRSLTVSLLSEANVLVHNAIQRVEEDKKYIEKNSCTSACESQFLFCMDHHGSQSSCRFSLSVCLNRCRGIDGRNTAWFYEHINYQGSILLRAVGEYPTLPSGWNNLISSMKVRYGLTVACYTGENFTGNLYEIRGDHRDLRGHPVGNDTISSMIVFQ